MHALSDTADDGDPEDLVDITDSVPSDEPVTAEEPVAADVDAADGDDPGVDSDEPDFIEDEMGRQRRENVRVDVQLPITLRLSGREAIGRTRDVSATGIGFSTRLPVELDQRGEVTVEFDGWRFKKHFVVRFVKPILAGSQIGVQFENLTQDEREKLVKQVFDVQRSQLQDSKRH